VGRGFIIPSVDKTKEIVFRRPCPQRYHSVPSIDGVALVDHIKILGVTLQRHLSFDLHVTELLKHAVSVSICCVFSVFTDCPLII